MRQNDGTDRVCLGHPLLKSTHEIGGLVGGKQAVHMAKHFTPSTGQALQETGGRLQKSVDFADMHSVGKGGRVV